MKKNQIYIAHPYLPERAEYDLVLDKIWETRILTNNGPLVQKLEKEIKNHLNLNDCEVILTSNGTKALEVAAFALGEFDEYLTTPFSFVATVNSLQWIGRKNIKYVDINSKTWTISRDELERQFDETKKTLGVFTHVFGNPCDIKGVQHIFSKNINSKILYDAAHAFNVNYNKESIFRYGDVSIASFHATKIFHTIEGGAIFCKDKILANKIRCLINFGIEDGKLEYIGTNAKMSEFNAGMGLILLEKNKEIQNKYRGNYLYFRDKLKELYAFQEIEDNTLWNYSYCPILARSESHLFEIFQALERIDVIARRYFYPSLNRAGFSGLQACPISEDISNRVLCIPIHVGLSEEKRTEILEVLRSMA